MEVYTFCRSAQNRPNGLFRSTWPQHWPGLGKALTSTQLGPISLNFGLTWFLRWRHLAETWTHLGATSAQVAAHMASKMGTWPAQSEILKAHQNAGFHWCFPSAALRLKGVKLSPQVPSCGMLELTWTSCITWLQFGTHLELWAQPIGANLGVQENATWATWAPLGEPIWRLQYDMLTTCQFYRHFHHVLPLMGARVRLAMSPTLGLSLHRTKLRMLCPTRVQTCPSYAMLDPSSAQVGPKLEPTDASSAQVGSCLAHLQGRQG